MEIETAPGSCGNRDTKLGSDPEDLAQQRVIPLSVVGSMARQQAFTPSGLGSLDVRQGIADGRVPHRRFGILNSA
jgi:hypothetical protein